MHKVLVADDNEDAVNSLAMLLELQGCQVMTTMDGQQALDASASFQPDIVILDISLPHLDGYDIARSIRRREEDASHAHDTGPAMLLVALTGWASPADRDKALACGFDFHFAKPLNPEMLPELLMQADAMQTAWQTAHPGGIKQPAHPPPQA